MINSLQSSTPAPILPDDTLAPWMGPLAPWMYQKVRDNKSRAYRWLLICGVVSVVLHILLLMIPIVKRMSNPLSGGASMGPITVTLANPKPRKAPAPAPHEETKAKPSQPAPSRSATIATKRTKPSKPDFVVSKPPVPSRPVIQPRVAQTAPSTPQEDDFSTQLAKRRAARQAVEDAAIAENQAASARPSRDAVALDNINRSMVSHTKGTGGVFQIKSIGVREGTFIFNGWHPGSNDNWHETYTVDAGEGGNVRLAIVRKEIEVIRKFYKGDFEFDSHLQGRVVTMSARLEDSAQLETFLMREMFDDRS